MSTAVAELSLTVTVKYSIATSPKVVASATKTALLFELIAIFNPPFFLIQMTMIPLRDQVASI
jgi:hypothetical protein